jgi:tetratricopeptide (TPR) repeat protein
MLLLLPFTAFAEIQTITQTIKQPFGGSQSPDDARTAGIARAKREALEQAGTYIESTTVVKNSQLDSDDIMALTAGVTKAEVIKQRNYTDGDAFGLEITVKVEFDTSVLENSLKRLLEDHNHLKELKDSREREKKLLSRIAELEKENQKTGKTKQQTETLRAEFKDASTGLTAVAWFDKGYFLWDRDKFSDPKKAIEYLSEAIRLDPNYVFAYNNRGIAYGNLNQFDRAIADYDQTIRLDPNSALAYGNRGNAYRALKQFDRAIADYDHAIRLDPNFIVAYGNRGIAYGNLNQFDRAIADYDQTIRIDPNLAVSYYNRGNAYGNLNQFDRAIADFDHAIRLDPNYADAYNSREMAYRALKQLNRL